VQCAAGLEHDLLWWASGLSRTGGAWRIVLVTSAGHCGLMGESAGPPVTVTFAGSGDAFGSGGRFQACIHVRSREHAPVLLDCGATSLTALKAAGLDPGEVSAVFVSHLHGDHFGGLPFLILDGQFTRRTSPLTVAGPPGTGARLREVMEALFPGPPAASMSGWQRWLPAPLRP